MVAVVVLHVEIIWITNSVSLFSGYPKKRNLYNDVSIYRKYAQNVSRGLVPYRDYLVEYPILSLPFFVLPSAFGLGPGTYKLGFIAEMLLVDFLLAFLVAREVRRRQGAAHVPAALAWYTLFFAAMSPLVVGRFDLVPTLAAFAAVCAWSGGRARTASALAGLGMLIKVFPAVAMLPYLMPGHPPRGRFLPLAVFLATVGLGALAWRVLGGPAWLESPRYHLERGIEIGSVPGGVLALFRDVPGQRPEVYSSHGCANLRNRWSSLLEIASPGVILGLILLVAVAGARGRCSDRFRCVAAAIVALMIGSKVLSPQFMIWLLPFPCVLVRGNARAVRVTFLAACLLTTLVYPHLYQSLVSLDLSAVLVLNTRNLVLCILFALLVWDGTGGASDAGETGDAPHPRTHI